MKIIDLLNKIAKGEEVPEKIKYEENEYEFNGKVQCYENQDEFFPIIQEIDLNDEIEIIEEKPKKIEEAKFKRFEETGKPITYQRFVDYNDFNIKELKRVTNELTKAVNYLLEKESDK